jgi:FKBP-type peptidyl-prolyl cis-trans isomerase
MKKYLLFIFLLSSGFCYAQNYNSAADKEWGPWKQHTCYKLLYYRAKKDFYEPRSNKQFWMIEVQNQYRKRVALSWYLFNPITQKPKEIDDQYSIGYSHPRLNPGAIDRMQVSVIGDGLPVIQIFSVCFEFRPDGQPRCSTGAVATNASFAICDNGVPIYKFWTAQEEADEEQARLRSGDPNYVHKETSKGYNSNSGSSTDKALDMMAKMLGVNNGGSTRYDGGRSGTPAPTRQQPAVAPSPPPSPAPAAPPSQSYTAPNAAALTGTKADADIFFATNGKRPGVITSASGLQYEVLRTGTGVKPTINDKVVFHFKRTNMVGGEVRDSNISNSDNQRVVATLLLGLAEGLQLMNAGSKYRLYIPSKMGNTTNFPGYPLGAVTSVWEVDLIEVIK